jgi:hypothetical protein
MADAKTLDHATYEQRKAELTEHLTAARAELRRVSLQGELGKSARADVNEARAVMTEIEQRQAALEEAWQEALAEAEARAKAADAEGRIHIYGEIEQLTAERGEVLCAVVAVLQGKRKAALGELVRRYDELSAEIRRKLAPFANQLGGDGDAFTDLIFDLTQRHRETELIDGALFGEQVWGMGSREAWGRLQEYGVEQFNEHRRREILRIASRLLPAAELEEAA